jgi:hypothetical protein
MAFDLESAAHLLEQALADRQPQPSALGALPRIADLLEGLKDPRQLVGGDASAGILDRKRDEGRVSGDERLIRRLRFEA